MMLNLHHKLGSSLAHFLLFILHIFTIHLVTSFPAQFPCIHCRTPAPPVECARSMSAVSVSSSSCSSIYPKFVFRFSFIVRPDSRKKEYIFICNVYYIPAKTNTARFPFLQMLMGARIMSSSHCMYLG